MRLLVLVLLFVAEAGRAASNAPVAAKNGMVVTAQHLATRSASTCCKQGGNAIDAAVAVGYALAVVYPAAGNLGGGGFMTMQLADGRKTFIDFREKAPLAATADDVPRREGQRGPGPAAPAAIWPSPCRARCPGSSTRARSTAR